MMKIKQRIDSQVLPMSRMGKAISILAGGTALAQLVVVVASPIITRIYSPDDFGVFAVYASILGMISVFASLGLEVAIPLPDDDRIAANLLAVSSAFVLLIAAVVVILIWQVGGLFSSITNLKTLGPYIWVLPAGVVTVGLYSVLTYWATRLRRYGAVARSRVGQSLLLVSVQIAVGVVAKSPFGLIAGQVSGPFAGMASIGHSTFAEIRSALARISTSGMRQALVKYRRFPLITAPGLFIESAGQLLPALLLAIQFGPAISGFYLLSQRIIGLPVALVTRSVSQVFVGEGASELRNSLTKFREMYLSAIRRLLLVAIGPVVLLAAVAPALFAFVFGEEWRESGEYTRLLTPVLLVQVIANPVAQTLNMLERQDLQLTWSVIRLALVLGALLLAKIGGWGVIASVSALSAAMVLAYLVHIGFCWGSLNRALRRTEVAE